MKRNLISIITDKSGIKEAGLQVTLSRIKKRHNLVSIEQAACYYIQKNKLDINISSIIDDRTLSALSLNSIRAPAYNNTINTRKKTYTPPVPKIKWIDTKYYSLSQNMGEFYPYLFIFENALRVKIDNVLKDEFGNWWEVKIKTELHSVYKYAADEENRKASLPMLGSNCILKPLDYVTIGHLESIIEKYKQEFVPKVFPTYHFFSGHMVIIKRVRNAIAHMSPSVLTNDVKNAKNEIDILLQHLSTVDI